MNIGFQLPRGRRLRNIIERMDHEDVADALDMYNELERTVTISERRNYFCDGAIRRRFIFLVKKALTYGEPYFRSVGSSPSPEPILDNLKIDEFLRYKKRRYNRGWIFTNL